MKKLIFLSKDILRADYLSCYNPGAYIPTPNIDRLALSGTRFNNYYCSAPSTGMAVTCMFSGLNAFQLNRKFFGEVSQFDQTKTVFTEFEDLNIPTFVFWTDNFYKGAYLVSKVFDKRTGINYIKGGYHNVSRERSRRGGRVADVNDGINLVDAFMKNFHEVDRENDRWFIWCHAPHVFRPRMIWGADIDIFDELVGRVCNELDADVVVSADHGHFNGEKGLITYAFDLYEGGIKIPLITSFSLGSPVIDYPVDQSQLKEILLKKSVDKKDFVYCDTRYYMQSGRKIMIRKDNYKYIYHKDSGGEELYDLSFDSNENINLLIDHYPDLERRFYYKLDEVIYYPSWDKAEEYYRILSEQRKRIWRSGNPVIEKICNLKTIRDAGILNSLKFYKKNTKVISGRWSSRARLSFY